MEWAVAGPYIEGGWEGKNFPLGQVPLSGVSAGFPIASYFEFAGQGCRLWGNGWVFFCAFLMSVFFGIFLIRLLLFRVLFAAIDSRNCTTSGPTIFHWLATLSPAH